MIAQNPVICIDFSGVCAALPALPLEDIVSALSDADLVALEDELDFYAFTGVPSRRMLEILDRAELLDDEWRPLLDADIDPDMPRPIAFKPRVIHRRDKARHQPFLAPLELSKTA